MGGQILTPFIMAPNTVGSLSVYIWYEFAEVGFPWRQLLPSFQAWLRGHSLGCSSQRTAAITAIITTPTSLARECQVRDIRDARLTRALPRPPSLLSTTDISTEQSRHSPVNPDTASESFSNPGHRKSSPTAEPLELARQMAGVFLAGKRGRIPVTPPSVFNP
ncbi:bcl-2-related protein A1 isoform X6 [Pteropus vampyrus]|uniref:Bcl-2-related protein A1 isoform X6 n=1 Tax=Pteropus vampyrus TaxID=132908 RepID=A0A6P6BL80_PTEVA|nr:bcl-2-related protein A1 isoform X6 [Pteropus vampyrus]